MTDADAVGRPPRVDAHHHVWTVARGDYSWLTPALTPLFRDFVFDDLRPHLLRAGIGRTVLVQAADTLAETGFLLDVARSNPMVGAVVGWVDMAAPDVETQLDRLMERSARFAGVRPMLQDLPDPLWVARRELDAAFDALIARGLRFDALVRPPHLAALADRLHRQPDLSVVIDHGAKPALARHAQEPDRFASWRAAMNELAQHDRVTVKLSGLITEAVPGWTTADLAPAVDVLLDLFGPERLMWGSDWPVCRMAGGFDAWWDATGALLAGLSAGEQDAILGGTAARVYGFSSELASQRVTT